MTLGHKPNQRVRERFVPAALIRFVFISVLARQPWDSMPPARVQWQPTLRLVALIRPEPGCSLLYVQRKAEWRQLVAITLDWLGHNDESCCRLSSCHETSMTSFSVVTKRSAVRCAVI